MAVELTPERITALDHLVESRAMSGRVHVHYGIDQGDAPRVRALLHEVGLAEGQVDLIVDDASHLVDPTRRSFETLFPYLRPGGKYVIEDWSWAHIGFGSHLPDEEPLSRVVFELTIALASRPDLVADISIDRDWAVITRGSAPVDPSGSLDVRALLGDRGRGVLSPEA